MPANVKTCKFPGCKAQISIKKPKFWPFSQTKNLNENENFYNFVIYVGYGGNQGNIHNGVS
jgi:hypothetical protein